MQTNCSLTEEISLHNVNGNEYTYHGRNGTIERSKENALAKPLYHDNLYIFEGFHEVIHKPLNMYLLKELCAQSIMNDFYESMDNMHKILEKLSDILNVKPDNVQAQRILDNVSRYTPMGIISSALAYAKELWILFFCSYVTVSILWHWIISKVQAHLWKRFMKPRNDQTEIPMQIQGPGKVNETNLQFEMMKIE